jgi:hypothetical protein
MNPFIDPEISRDHFPVFDHGIAVVDSPSVDENNHKLDWSIDTLAHMAQLKGNEIRSPAFNIPENDNPDHVAKDLAKVEEFWSGADPTRDQKLALLVTPIRENGGRASSSPINMFMHGASSRGQRSDMSSNDLNYSSSSEEPTGFGSGRSSFSRSGKEDNKNGSNHSMAEEFMMWHAATIHSLHSPKSNVFESPMISSPILSSPIYSSPPHQSPPLQNKNSGSNIIQTSSGTPIHHASSPHPKPDYSQRPPVTPAPSRLRDSRMMMQSQNRTPEWGSAVKQQQQHHQQHHQQPPSSVTPQRYRSPLPTSGGGHHMGFHSSPGFGGYSPINNGVNFHTSLSPMRTPSPPFIDSNNDTDKKKQTDVNGAGKIRNVTHEEMTRNGNGTSANNVIRPRFGNVDDNQEAEEEEEEVDEGSAYEHRRHPGRFESPMHSFDSTISDLQQVS